MFTIEEVNKENKEITLLNKYMNWNVPNITSIDFMKTQSFYGQVKESEILEEKYIIHFSNNLNSCQQEYQMSVIWHEATHINDIIALTKLFDSETLNRNIFKLNE